jgi:lysophospholipase L1-like esterase
VERWQRWTVAGLAVALAGVLISGEVHARRVAEADAAAAVRFAQTHPDEAGLASTVPVSTGAGVGADGRSQAAPGNAGSGQSGDAAAAGSAQAALAQPAPGSIAAWLRTVADRQGSVRIAFLGSSGTAGQGASRGEGWTDRLVQDLAAVRIRAVPTNLAVAAASSSVIAAPWTVQAAIQAHPDLVFVETGAVADWAQGVPPETSLENLDRLYAKLHAALPDARIVWLSPNPIQAETVRNAAGATYADYLDQEAAHARARGWTYIDVHAAMADALQAEAKPLSSILVDAYHVGAAGARLWAVAVEQALAGSSTG